MTTQRVTAPLVKGIVDDHITKHRDVYDRKLHKHEVALFGERGDNGIVHTQQEMSFIINSIKEKLDGLNKIGIALILVISTELIIRVMNLV